VTSVHVLLLSQNGIKPLKNNILKIIRHYNKMKNIFLLFILFAVLFIQSVYGLDIADKEIQYIPYEDREDTLDVVYCSENNYFRKAEFTLGYACYKAIDERVLGFGTRVDHLNRGDYSIFELAAVSEISKIEIIFYEGQARQYNIKIQVAVAGAHVQGDENLVKWKTVFSGKTPDVGGTKENPDPVVIKFNAPVDGQFIRIIGNGNYLDGSNTLGGDHTSYSDIQIFGTKTDEVYTYQNIH
jgi:hypothetical protein